MLNIKNIIKNYKFYKEKSKFMKNWEDLMFYLDKYNKDLETFTIQNVIKSNVNEFKCRILVPIGLLKDQLTEIKPYIEDAFCCKFEYEKIQGTHFVNAKFIF